MSTAAHHQHHPTVSSSTVTDHDAGTTTGPTTTPYGHHNNKNSHLIPAPADPHVRLICSFGGRILPRPRDNQLRYVGGETRIVSVNRQLTFNILISKLSKLSGLQVDMSVKYQLPNEDLDVLVSVITDEDVENMIEEYERVSESRYARKTVNGHRLRLFLFPPLLNKSPSTGIRSATSRQNWFVEALNGGGVRVAHLERSGRSEASSVMSSEVPDYLFGLDSSYPEEQYSKGKIGMDNTPGNKLTTLLESPGSNTTSSPPYGCCGSPPPLPHLPLLRAKPSDQNHHNQYFLPPTIHHVERPNRPGSTDVTHALAVQQQQLEEQQQHHRAKQQQALSPPQQQQYYVPQPTSIPVFYVSGPISVQLSSYNQQQQTPPLPIDHQLPTAVPYPQPMYNHQTGGVVYVSSSGSMSLSSLTTSSSPVVVVDGYDYPLALAPSDGDGIQQYARPPPPAAAAAASATTAAHCVSPIYDYPPMTGTGIDIPTTTTVDATGHSDHHTNCLPKDLRLVATPTN